MAKDIKVVKKVDFKDIHIIMMHINQLNHVIIIVAVVVIIQVYLQVVMLVVVMEQKVNLQMLKNQIIMGI